MLNADELLTRFNPETGAIDGCKAAIRRLSDLKNLFVNRAAYAAALSNGNPTVYTVSTLEPAKGEGQLHLGVGVLMPGRIGDEYYFTKGHLHSWGTAAEFYIGIKGRGMMVLQDESSLQSVVLDLLPNSIVYVPGNTAHRTVNVGDTPLIYVGVYPSEAGHDYAALEKQTFRKVIVARNNTPTVLDRKDFDDNGRVFTIN